MNGLSANERVELPQHLVAREIPLNEFHADDRIHRQNIQRNEATLAVQYFRRELAPAARSRAQIDDGHARADEAIGALNLFQLEDSARAIALLARTLHINVALVFLQPTMARFGTFRHPSRIEVSILRGIQRFITLTRRIRARSDYPLSPIRYRLLS
jgi:hypothetical protein